MLRASKIDRNYINKQVKTSIQMNAVQLIQKAIFCTFRRNLLMQNIFIKLQKNIPK